jgi:hypothetical protein
MEEDEEEDDDGNLADANLYDQTPKLALLFQEICSIL